MLINLCLINYRKKDCFGGPFFLSYLIMIAGWIILSILCGVLANSNGRSGFGYFLLSLLLSPLIGFIAVLIAGENKEETDNAKIASGESKKCPDCAELIKIEAKVCKHCGKKLTLSKEEKDVIASRIDYYACDCGAINNEMNVGIVCGKCKSKVIGRKNNLDATGPMK